MCVCGGGGGGGGGGWQSIIPSAKPHSRFAYQWADNVKMYE